MDKLSENYIIADKKLFCKKCGAPMEYKYAGIYGCTECEYTFMDDFGKVKNYINLHGPTSGAIISDATGVSLEKINGFLRKGRVEIPEGSEFYIKCERCGTDIRYGRFCPECVRELAGKITVAFTADEIGEKPKHKQGGKMRFFHKYD
ncbi:flagellar protein [Lachnospiraceae bacterium KM106-2]|nr:flagellar protein [Lachnospiraceae bacterium KM106-2]